jgi:magnesium-transporting ATPase (P-type)
MLIIATSDKKGWCYIETKNLDGETNKKIKMAEKKEMFSRVGYNHWNVIFLYKTLFIILYRKKNYQILNGRKQLSKE